MHGIMCSIVRLKVKKYVKKKYLCQPGDNQPTNNNQQQGGESWQSIMRYEGD